MKKMILILAIVAMAVGASAQTYYDFEADGIYYKFENGENGENVKVTSKYKYASVDYDYHYVTEQVSYSGVVSVPDKVKYNDKTYSVTEIDAFAFCNCTDMTWLTLPESVTTIGKSAISNCGNLRIDLPKSIEYIEERAFNGTVVENIQVLELPNINTLSYYALAGSSFDKVVIGGDVWGVKSQAFANSNIESIDFMSNNLQQNRGEELHLYVKGLAGFKGKEIRLPERMFHISFETIADCPNLERVYFPAVEHLGHGLYMCSWYSESGAESGGASGNGPFEYQSINLISRCPNLKEVVCYSATPPGFYKFGNFQYEQYYIYYATITDNEDCVLKVPAGSEELYRLDPVWGHFKTIEGFEPGEYTGVYEVAAVGAPCEQPVYYNLQGQRIDHPQPGHLYIRKQGSQVKKMVY